MNNSTGFLHKIVTVKMDRPLGSLHPKHNFIYPVNYGFIPNTKSYDNEELDAYVLGVYEPLEIFTGKCIACIHRLDDNDDKLIVVPEDRNFTDDEIDVLTEFQERFFKHVIIRNVTTNFSYDNLIFRKMLVSDYNCVNKLVNQVHELHLNNLDNIYRSESPLSLGRFANLLIDDYRYNYVAEYNGTCVGIIMAEFKEIKDNDVLNDKKILYINNICVDENFRNRGIGTFLFDSIIKLGKSLKIDDIEVLVWPFNRSGMYFYESLGMTIKNTRYVYSLKNH